PSKTIAILLTAVLFISSITVLAELNNSNQSQNISVSKSLANESFQISNFSQNSTTVFPVKMDDKCNLSNQASSLDGVIDNNSSLFIWNSANIGQDSSGLEWQTCLGGSGTDY